MKKSTETKLWVAAFIALWPITIPFTLFMNTKCGKYWYLRQYIASSNLTEEQASIMAAHCAARIEKGE